MNAVTYKQTIMFPQYSGIRCLMMPYIQGRPESVPEEYRAGYEDIIENVFHEAGQKGFLTIDESIAFKNKPHRGSRAKFDRALHTEAGLDPESNQFQWGYTWGSNRNVTLDPDTQVLLANNLDNTCALWNVEHSNTSVDGDIGDFANEYPYIDSIMMKAGEVHQIGILTPHESLPVSNDIPRQFLRIIGSGVHGREPYFTENPLI